MCLLLTQFETGIEWTADPRDVGPIGSFDQLGNALRLYQPACSVVVALALASTASIASKPRGAEIQGSKPISISRWVATVCSTLGRWNDGIQRSVDDERAKLSASATLPPSARARKAKRILVAFIHEIVALTSNALKTLNSLPPPDTQSGAAINTSFVRDFTKTLKGFETAQAKTNLLSTARPAVFGEQVGRIAADISELGKRARRNFARLGMKEPTGTLAAAIDANSTCRAFSNVSSAV